MKRTNKWMKGVAGCAIAAAFTLLASLSAFAATGRISFSDPSVSAGTEVNVTMKITADDGAALSDATVTLKYPSDRLTFVSGTDSDGGAGTIRVHGASNGQGTDTLEYNLRFQTGSAGSYSISVDTYEVYDGEGQPVELSHVGSSAVQVNAVEAASSNADLKTLEVDPGELTPAFSAGTTAYSLTVGTSVDKLGINALSADNGASVMVSGNDALQMGTNTVTVHVTAADGQTSKDYVLTVEKQEGGPESSGTTGETADGQATVEGVQLSSRGKTITIMNPSADVQIPEGLKAGMLSIDGQRVQGWVWGADAEPQYCIVYGMNDQGEMNFYRYDLTEKTIQRYFEDPLAADAVSSQTYSELETTYGELQHSAELRFLIICVLALISIVLLALVIYLSAKLRGASEAARRAAARGSRMRSDRGTARVEMPEADELSGEAILRHSFDTSDELSGEVPEINDETQVIRRPERRKRLRREVSGDTMPIPTIHKMGEAADSEEADELLPEYPDEAAEHAESGEQTDGSSAQAAEAAADETSRKDQTDDEFETFDL